MYMANKAPEIFPGACFAVAHCNFGLRGEESDGDEEFVRNWCGRKGVECHVRRFGTQEYSVTRGISIEMAARELRYAWFGELCAEHGYDALAVAHNADDNAETLMLNLLRGTGTRGMRGMAAESTKYRNIPLILRPLLNVSRESIREWMVANGMSWREDRSNAESEVKRNKLRNQVFPVFKEINPSFVRTLGEDMKRVAQVDDIAEDYFRTAREAILLPDGSISAKKLLGFKHWEYLLWRLLEGSHIGADEFSSLVDCLRAGRQLGGKTFGPVTGHAGWKLKVRGV